MGEQIVRPTLFLRIKHERIGFFRKKFDNGMFVRYNKTEGPYYFDTLADHAASHDGRLLIWFRNVMDVETVRLCGTMVIWEGSSEDNRYLTGHIVEAGKGSWNDGLQVGGYKKPDSIEYVWSSTRNGKWVKLDHVRAGTQFPFDEYTKITYTPSSGLAQQPLEEVVDDSRNMLMTALPNLA